MLRRTEPLLWKREGDKPTERRAVRMAFEFLLQGQRGSAAVAVVGRKQPRYVLCLKSVPLPCPRHQLSLSLSGTLSSHPIPGGQACVQVFPPLPGMGRNYHAMPCMLACHVCHSSFSSALFNQKNEAACLFMFTQRMCNEYRTETPTNRKKKRP